MRPRRLFVVAYDFPPHAAIGTQRTLRVVRRLAASGWDITVLTGEPATFKHGTPVDSGLLDRVPAGVNVLRAPVWRPVTAMTEWLRPAKRGGSASPSAAGTAPRPSAPAPAASRRSLLASVANGVDIVSGIPDGESGWMVPALYAGIREARQTRPDVIYSSAPPWTGHLVATRLASWFRVPLVLDFRDPWARAPWRSARSAWIANAAAARLERFVIRRASAVIFATQAAAGEFTRCYGASDAAKFHVVPNGCDASIFDGLPGREAGSPEVLLHAGSLYGGRNPMPLLRVVARLLEDNRLERTLRLRFVGPVSLPGVDLPGASRELGIEDLVEFIPRLSHRETLEQMRTAAALLLLQPGTTMSVPAKAYEYLAAGRPVLALTEEGETAELIRASGMGCAVRPNDEHAIADALLRVLGLSRGIVPAAAPALFDGNVRAAETEAVLASVVDAALGAVRPARAAAHVETV